MTTIRMQVALSNVNGVPADTITNTWHALIGGADPVVQAANFYAALVDFYEIIDTHISTSVDDTFAFKAYDLEDDEPRIPIYTNTATFSLGANAPLPHEVAICLSYNSLVVSGIPAGRRRGRIYLGPLDSNVMDDSLGQSIVQSTVCETIRTAAEGLMDAGSDVTFKWAVFSPTTAGPPPWSDIELVGSTHSVTHGYVDNAFDTIRSRGTLATARVIFPS